MQQDPYDPDTNPGTLPRATEAELEEVGRKLDTRTVAGAIAIVLALSAAIVAIVLALDARDNSASKSELERIERELGGVAETAGEAEGTQSALNSLSERVDANSDEIEKLQKTDADNAEAIPNLEDEVEDLRKQISDLRDASSGGSGPGNSGNSQGGNSGGSGD